MYYTRLAAEETPKVIISTVNPGYCVSGLKPPTDFGTRMAERVMARSTEEGARIIVDAIVLEKAQSRNGAYLDECAVKMPSCFLTSKEGKAFSERVWTELNNIVDRT